MTDDRETWYRVPRSAEECAVHLEAGGVVETGEGFDWVSLEGSGVRSVDFRMFTDFRSYDYRLVYSTPVGMSPVIGAPGHAYGLAKDAPVGWPSSGHGDNTAPMNVAEAFTPYCIIEARPPAPAPEPRTEKVPLTKLVGRTIHGCNEAVHRTDSPIAAYAALVQAIRDAETLAKVREIVADNPRQPAYAGGLIARLLAGES